MEKRETQTFPSLSSLSCFFLFSRVYSKFGILLLSYFYVSSTFSLLSCIPLVCTICLYLPPFLFLSVSLSFSSLLLPLFRFCFLAPYRYLLHVCLLLKLHIPLKTAFGCKIHVKMHSQNIFAYPKKQKNRWMIMMEKAHVNTNWEREKSDLFTHVLS